MDEQHEGAARSLPQSLTTLPAHPEKKDSRRGQRRKVTPATEEDSRQPAPENKKSKAIAWDDQLSMTDGDLWERP